MNNTLKVSPEEFRRKIDEISTEWDNMWIAHDGIENVINGSLAAAWSSDAGDTFRNEKFPALKQEVQDSIERINSRMADLVDILENYNTVEDSEVKADIVDSQLNTEDIFDL